MKYRVIWYDSEEVKCIDSGIEADSELEAKQFAHIRHAGSLPAPLCSVEPMEEKNDEGEKGK